MSTNQSNDLLFAFLILAMAIITSIDHFVTESVVSQFITGLLSALMVVGGIVYVYRISTQLGKRS